MHSHKSCPGFLFLTLEDSVHWSTRSETFSPEHSLVLSCVQVFLFWFSNLILLFFWSDCQVSLRLTFQDPFVLWLFWCSLVYLLPCLHFWVLFSIYVYPTIFPYCLDFGVYHQHIFMNFIFLLVKFLVYIFSWLAPIWLVCVVSKKLENFCFLSRQYCPFFWYHC